MFPTPHNHNHDDERLERFIHRTLRGLPPRRAPRSLEERVFAELARRAALPWWRKSFLHWPLVARAAFVLLSAAVIRFAFMIGMWVVTGFDGAQLKQSFAQQFAWIDSLRTVVNAISGCFAIIERNIPPLWLYGGLLFFAAMYFALFGLGAAAYKALYADQR